MGIVDSINEEQFKDYRRDNKNIDPTNDSLS